MRRLPAALLCGCALMLVPVGTAASAAAPGDDGTTVIADQSDGGNSMTITGSSGEHESDGSITVRSHSESSSRSSSTSNGKTVTVTKHVETTTSSQSGDEPEAQSSTSTEVTTGNAGSSSSVGQSNTSIVHAESDASAGGASVQAPPESVPATPPSKASANDVKPVDAPAEVRHIVAEPAASRSTGWLVPSLLVAAMLALVLLGGATFGMRRTRTLA